MSQGAFTEFELAEIRSCLPRFTKATPTVSWPDSTIYGLLATLDAADKRIKRLDTEVVMLVYGQRKLADAYAVLLENSEQMRLAIAKSPDLLALLIECKPRLESLEDSGPPHEGWQSEELIGLVERVRAAIARAGGGEGG